MLRKTTLAFALLVSPSMLAGCGDAAQAPSDSASENVGTSEQAVTTAPSDVYIEGPIRGVGTGCPSGTIVPTIAPDRKSFTVLFSEMQLEYPPGPGLKSKNCAVSMNIHVPQGWQYSVATINTRGYADLTANVSARQISSYFFSGVPLGGQAHSTIVGPTPRLGELYTYTDYVGFSSLVWSPCGSSRPFTINSRIILDARSAGPSASAIFSNDTVDGEFQKVIGWEWRPCRQ